MCYSNLSILITIRLLITIRFLCLCVKNIFNKTIFYTYFLVNMSKFHIFFYSKQVDKKLCKKVHTVITYFWVYLSSVNDFCILLLSLIHAKQKDASFS